MSADREWQSRGSDTAVKEPLCVTWGGWDVGRLLTEQTMRGRPCAGVSCRVVHRSSRGLGSLNVH